jgi:hypothetical protein
MTSSLPFRRFNPPELWVAPADVSSQVSSPCRSTGHSPPKIHGFSTGKPMVKPVGSENQLRTVVKQWLSGVDVSGLGVIQPCWFLVAQDLLLPMISWQLWHVPTWPRHFLHRALEYTAWSVPSVQKVGSRNTGWCLWPLDSRCFWWQPEDTNLTLFVWPGSEKLTSGVVFPKNSASEDRTWKVQSVVYGKKWSQ